MKETEIISELKKGNKIAFKQLVENYQKMVINTCMGLVHNHEDAEDIAQDVFIEVFRAVEQFREDSKISTWLYRIAVNRSLNFIRDNKKRKWFWSFEESIKNDSGKKFPINSAETPEEKMESDQRAKILHRAIDSLPKNQRIAFVLSKYDDLNYNEISEIMNLSKSSVESLIHRAKINLQKKLYTCFKKRCF